MNIEDRVQHLEIQNCRWRRVATCLILLLVAVIIYVCLSQSPSATLAQTSATVGALRATRLEIVNTKGEPIAAIGGDETGGRLTLLRTGNGVGVSLSASPWLMLTGENSTIAIDATSLSLEPVDLEKATRRKAWMKAKLDRGEISLTNTSGEEKQFWAENADTPAVKIGLTEQRGGIVNVCNPLGKVVVSAQSSKTNEGLVWVSDVNGAPTRFLSTK